MKPIGYDTTSGEWFVYDKYIVVELKSEIDVYKKEADKLNELVSKHIRGDFGLIANRIHKNSINPEVYQYAKERMPNFSAFALVVYSDLAKDNYQMESKFIKRANIKCELFYSLEKAKAWMESIL